MNRTLKDVEQYVESRIKEAQEKCDRFLISFAKNPGYALDWGFDTFEAGAWLEVLRPYQVFLKDTKKTNMKVDLDKMTELLEESVINKSRWQHYSTSPTANLYAQKILSVSAEFLNYLKGKTL